ncbi:MAG TPA: hypothetical protein PKC30_15620 [Saprospiraceae bacterium]|nr:hypothetical protein [Saprospiraceae bacterium]
MKSKLTEFKKFASTLLPHETRLLISEHQMTDPDRINILHVLNQNSHSKILDFDENIDKRKYSHLKKWISGKLLEWDVDTEYQWLLESEKDIIQDAISPAIEEKLITYLNRYTHPSFYFIKLYEVARLYSHFLLPRLRINAYRNVQSFLSKYEYSYQEHILILDTLQKASKPIVLQYTKGKPDTSGEWTTWLNELMLNERIQGYYRYLALIRIHFIALQQKEYEKILKKYEYFDPILSMKGFYSRRISGNYYYNLMNIHSALKNYSQANKYGNLAIKIRNHDFLQYSTQFASNLLLQDNAIDAIEVLRNAHGAYKESNNHLRKTDYVSYYLQCLRMTGQQKAAANYGHSYLAVYKKEVLENRWDIFFSQYLSSLMELKKYKEVKWNIEKHNLLFRDKELSKSKEESMTIEDMYEQCKKVLAG